MSARQSLRDTPIIVRDLRAGAAFLGQHHQTAKNAVHMVQAADAIEALEHENKRLLEALQELHAIDERKLAASERRPYAIGHSVIKERVERNRAILRSLGEE